jgi:hypothetical protein
MVLQNHVILQNDIPARLHLTDHHIERRTITDPVTGGPSIRNVLVFDVDRLNGAAVGALFSTMAEKLAGHFEPYLKDKSYRNYEVVITQSGEGFQRRWSVQFIPFITR